MIVSDCLPHRESLSLCGDAVAPVAERRTDMECKFDATGAGAGRAPGASQHPNRAARATPLAPAAHRCQEPLLAGLLLTRPCTVATRWPLVVPRQPSGPASRTRATTARTT